MGKDFLRWTLSIIALLHFHANAVEKTSITKLAAEAGIMTGQSYVLKRHLTIGSLKMERGQLTADNFYSLPENAEVQILAISEDPFYGPVVNIGMDVDAEEGIAPDMWVSLADLLSAHPELTALEPFSDDTVDLAGGYDDTQEFGYSTEVAGGSSSGRSGTGARRRTGMTYCYREVKQTLLKMKICKHYVSGSMAWQGYKVLQKECGMQSVGKPSLTSLPIGAVCVSSGGRSCGSQKCGHIAVKISSNTWYGAGYRGTPWISGRTPMGCLVKNAGDVPSVEAHKETAPQAEVAKSTPPPLEIETKVAKADKPAKPAKAKAKIVAKAHSPIKAKAKTKVAKAQTPKKKKPVTVAKSRQPKKTKKHYNVRKYRSHQRVYWAPTSYFGNQ